jgi:hypothetical protein
MPNEDNKPTEFDRINLTKVIPISDAILSQLREESAQDSEMQTLKKTVLKGWPGKADMVPLEFANIFRSGMK